MKRVLMKLAMLGLSLIAVACGGTQVKGFDPSRTELDDARDAFDQDPSDTEVREYYKTTTVEQEAAWIAVAQDALLQAGRVRLERCALTHLPADCDPVEPSDEVSIRIDAWALKSVRRQSGNWPVWVDPERVVIFDPSDPSLSRSTTITPAVLPHLPACVKVTQDGDWTVQKCAAPAPAPAAPAPGPNTK